MPTPLRCLMSFALLALVGLVACGDGGGGGAGSAAVGTWKLDGEATATANEAAMAAGIAGQPEAMQEMAVNMMKQMFSTAEISMTLKADNTLTGKSKLPNPLTGEANEETITGTWKMVGDKISLTVKDPSGKEDTQTATIDGKKMTATMSEDGQEMSMVFTKQ